MRVKSGDEPRDDFILGPTLTHSRNALINSSPINAATYSKVRVNLKISLFVKSRTLDFMANAYGTMRSARRFYEPIDVAWCCVGRDVFCMHSEKHTRTLTPPAF